MMQEHELLLKMVIPPRKSSTQKLIHVDTVFYKDHDHGVIIWYWYSPLLRKTFQTRYYPT